MPIVYGVNASPFVRKVRVFLAEKGIAYELDPVIPVNVSAEFRKMSPLGKVPAFRDGDRTLSDSSIICAYLERMHPQPALYPADAYDYARALWFEEYGDGGLSGVIGAKKPGQTIKLGLRRAEGKGEYKKMTVEVTLAKRPNSVPNPNTPQG